jgi:hypothetical protein
MTVDYLFTNNISLGVTESGLFPGVVYYLSMWSVAPALMPFSDSDWMLGTRETNANIGSHSFSAVLHSQALSEVYSRGVLAT